MQIGVHTHILLTAYRLFTVRTILLTAYRVFTVRTILLTAYRVFTERTTRNTQIESVPHRKHIASLLKSPTG
jgi:hypothetical protein